MVKIKTIKEIKMAYPPISDPTNETWIIAFDLKLKKLYEYARNPDNIALLNDKTPDVFVRDLRAIMFNEIYDTLKPYGFDKRLQNSLVFNNNRDATIAFKAISKGLSQSWTKYFIERVHLFKVDPNSDASDLLNKDQNIAPDDRPDWLDDNLLNFIIQNSDELDELSLFE